MQPQAKECEQPLKARKGKEIDFSLEPPERTHLYQHLDLSPGDCIWTSDLQNYKRINGILSHQICGNFFAAVIGNYYTYAQIKI